MRLEYYKYSFGLLFVLTLTSLNISCQENSKAADIKDVAMIDLDEEIVVIDRKPKISKIDLSHWSITTPELNVKGSATSVEPPEILNYATDERLIPYMYNDSSSGTLVFYAYPSNATTANTKYSRTELREQMVPGDNNVNWTFAQGATMKGKLAMEEVTKDSDGKYHRVIIMQIHGRLTNEQKELIGAKDNNAPPVLKIYWDKGKIRVKTKVLKDRSASDIDILYEEAWDDDEGYNFPTEVGFRKFTLEVKVEKGKMTIILNNAEYAVYEGLDINRWNVFENYFKAGNYFQSTDEGAYAKVKYYELAVTH